MTIGGTNIALLPTRGGETDDALLIHLPELGVVFVGDVLMPYLGAPFIEEGSIEGLLQAIDQVSALRPRVLLHGHDPLNRLFASTAMLDDLRGHIGWLREEVLGSMKRGADRAAIQQANLVPPALKRSASEVHQAYLVMRENIINRLFDQHSGYWQNGLQGLDVLSDRDRGEALFDYLRLSEKQVITAAEQLMVDGKHEQAAALVRWARAHRPGNAGLDAAYVSANLKLMEKAQETDPFKFIVYGGEIDHAMRSIDRLPPGVTEPAAR
jgi:hypothetical protein